MPVFSKLADPATYVACTWDLRLDAAGRAYWVGMFKRHLETILNLGIEAAVARGEDLAAATRAAARSRDELTGRLDAFSANPDLANRVTILSLDEWRDQALRRHGFTDAFVDLKARENAQALALLPAVCREVDALAAQGPAAQLRALVEGIFAGNIFDMGAEQTAAAFLKHSPDFFATRRQLPPRPWLIDDYDLFEERMLGSEARGKRAQGRERQQANGSGLLSPPLPVSPSPPLFKKAVFFIDNAGSDFLLGTLPMIRWLAGRGTEVVLVANERPTLNDMTIHDVNAWWPRIVAAEPSFNSPLITRVTSGTGEPLIDLLQVSPELNSAAHDADLVILEGMGRGVESNLDAAFDCDVLNIAMLKDAVIAQRLGGKIFDVVCRFVAKEE